MAIGCYTPDIPIVGSIDSTFTEWWIRKTISEEVTEKQPHRNHWHILPGTECRP